MFAKIYKIMALFINISLVAKLYSSAICGRFCEQIIKRLIFDVWRNFMDRARSRSKKKVVYITHKKL